MPHSACVLPLLSSKHACANLTDLLKRPPLILVRASPLFSSVTLPLIAPAFISMAHPFTLSFDDLVIASFVSRLGSSTLPIVIFSSQAWRHTRNQCHRNLDDCHNWVGVLLAPCLWDASHSFYKVVAVQIGESHALKVQKERLRLCHR